MPNSRRWSFFFPLNCSQLSGSPRCRLSDGGRGTREKRSRIPNPTRGTTVPRPSGAAARSPRLKLLRGLNPFAEGARVVFNHVFSSPLSAGFRLHPAVPRRRAHPPKAPGSTDGEFGQVFAPVGKRQPQPSPSDLPKATRQRGEGGERARLGSRSHSREENTGREQRQGIIGT